MAMTKKDYTTVAKALRAQKDNVLVTSNIQTQIIRETAETIAAHFALVNDNFKKDVFMEAAGFGENNNA